MLKVALDASNTRIISALIKNGQITVFYIFGYVQFLFSPKIFYIRNSILMMFDFEVSQYQDG